MNALKKCLSQMASSRPAARLLALVLVVALAILPTMAEILSTLPDPPTYTGKGWNTSYDSAGKVDRVDTPVGPIDLPYTEHTYTVNVHANYLNDKLENTTLSKEAIKEILRENLPGTVYDMIIARDPQAIKDIIADYIKNMILDYFRSEDDAETTETGAADELVTVEQVLNGNIAEDIEDLVPADGVITEDILQQIKDLGDKLVGEDKPFTKEQIVDIIDMEKLADHFGITELPVIEGTEELDKIKFLDELLQDTKHDEDILASNKALKDIAQDVVDVDKLETVEVSYAEILRIFLSEVKGDIVDLVARIKSVTMGEANVEIFSEAEGQDGKLNLSAFEQILLDSIPTLDELVEILGSGETRDVLYEMNFFVHMKKKDTENEFDYHNYVIRIEIDGDKQERADLGKYIQDAEDFFSYEYELPAEADRYSFEDGKSDGTISFNVKLPVGLLNLALKVINEKNLPADIKAKLGTAAELDFSNEENHPVIIDAIIQSCTIKDLVDMLSSVKGADLSPESLDKYHLTAQNVDDIVDALNRGMNELEKNDFNFGDLDSKALTEFYANGAFTYTDVLYADAIEAVENIRTLPEYVKNRLIGTELRHTLRVNITLEDIHRVTYTRGGVDTVVYLEKGSALDAQDGYGWIEDGVETKLGNVLTQVPDHDVRLTVLRKLTYRYRYTASESYKQFITYFTEKTIDSVAQPTSKPGYVFEWDFAGVDGSRDVVLELSQATPLTYDKPVTWTIDGVEQPAKEVTFTYGQPIIEALNATLGRPADKAGYTGAWWIYEETTTRTRAATTETGTWRKLTAEDMPTADNVPLTVAYRYTAIEYERVYVNGELQVGLKFTVEQEVLTVVSGLTASLKEANPGFDVAWYYGDVAGGVAVGAEDKPEADKDLRLFYQLVETETQPPETETQPPETETQPPETETQPVDPSVDPYKAPGDAGMQNCSFDTFYVNGEMYFPDGGAGDKLDAINNTLTFWAGEPHDSMALRGWIGFNQPVDQFGYYIDGYYNVTWGDFKQTTEAGVIAAGGEHATRFQITADISGLDVGEHKVGYVVKLADGTLVRLRTEITVVISDEEEPTETEPETDPPVSDTETEPPVSDTETEPPVSDTETEPPVSDTETETETEPPVIDTETETQDEPPATETEPETTLPGPGANGMIDSSFEGFYVNGNKVEDHNWSEAITFKKGDHHSLTLNGWIGFDQPIAQFGYYIDNQAYVWNDTFKTAPADGHKGGENASGFSIAVDLRELDLGDHYVTFIVRLEDGTICQLRDPSSTLHIVIEEDTDDGFPWWILLLILLLVIIIVLVILLILRRKKNTNAPTTPPPPAPAETETQEAPAVEEAPAEEPVADTTPLFIPLGEEIPEEEIPDEIEILEEVSAEVVDDLMSDKVAEHFLEISVEEGGTGKMGIINVGQISENYQPEDHVNLADLQDKGLVDDNIGRLKVLAAGKLDKPLYIKADAFSVQAIKMITLTGGHAIKLGSGVVRPTEKPASDDDASDTLFDAHEETETED